MDNILIVLVGILAVFVAYIVFGYHKQSALLANSKTEHFEEDPPTYTNNNEQEPEPEPEPKPEEEEEEQEEEEHFSNPKQLRNYLEDYQNYQPEAFEQHDLFRIEQFTAPSDTFSELKVDDKFTKEDCRKMTYKMDNKSYTGMVDGTTCKFGFTDILVKDDCVFSNDNYKSHWDGNNCVLKKKVEVDPFTKDKCDGKFEYDNTKIYNASLKDGKCKYTTPEAFTNYTEHFGCPMRNKPSQSVDDFYRLSLRPDAPVQLKVFYAPWCGYCKQFAPVYSGLSTALDSNGLSFVGLQAINGDENSDLCRSYGVDGFPTIIVETQNGMKTVYNGDRSAESIVNFLKNL
jgi:thiol-disulfide isomerase/thioredoxin